MEKYEQGKYNFFMTKNKKYFVIVFLAGFFIFLSCSKGDEYIQENSPPLLENLKLSQPEILFVSNSGISLRFYFESYGNATIEEYGVVWYYDENKELLQNCVKSFYGKPQKREVSLNIENGLPKGGTIYIRAYAKIAKNIYYGQYISVHPMGGNRPVINKISPENPKLSQQIKIEGDGFVKTINTRYQSVLVNGFEIIPDTVSENTIFFTLPSEYIESYMFDYNMKISLKVFGEEYSYNKECHFISPWKKLNLPDDFSSFAFKKGTATVLNNKAYILFGKQYGKMFVYDIPGNQWTVIEYPGKPEQEFFRSQINCYNFTANNKVYSIIDEILYSKNESSAWQEVSKYPGNPETNIKPFAYYHNGNLYKGNFDQNYEGKGRSFYKYNINTNSWTELTPIPNNGGSIYHYFVFFYEDNLNIGMIRINESYDYSKNIRMWYYSINEDNWSWNYNTGIYNDFPAMYYFDNEICFEVDNQIFLGLGQNSYDWPEYCSNRLWRFNPQTKYWDMVSRCPDKINVSATFIYNNKAYILGTEQDDGFEEKNIYRKKYFYEFDPSLI
jgi:hypothetical protein